MMSFVATVACLVAIGFGALAAEMWVDAGRARRQAQLAAQDAASCRDAYRREFERNADLVRELFRLRGMNRALFERMTVIVRDEAEEFQPYVVGDSTFSDN